MSRFKVFVSRLQIKRPCLFVIFRTCDSKKRIPLSADYPELCPALENAPDNNAAQYCIGPRMNKWRPEKLNKTIAKEIEYQIHNYARYVWTKVICSKKKLLTKKIMLESVDHVKLFLFHTYMWTFVQARNRLVSLINLYANK